ncbi:DUF4224 domain-containing protein [Nitrosomonas marina]|uniref:DUF4224 domain-containing protein n=1 Tax=Nitrosomonas marina TaxID=917 RepID=A0A1H8GK85_9PROT|nr:DUF4224 domain-containing protein [Nitrosomonas marina]SEN44412.1 protein of unknown function [Nitrosomonas marina]
MDIFLDYKAVARLTKKKRKSCQIAALRSMGIPFFINPSGEPIVAIKAVEGGKVDQIEKPWQSNALK